MAYQKLTFANGTTPAVNDDNLNHMQTQYDEAKAYADSIKYTHPTGDGNLHVPATGTTNSGKVLTAGPTAGSLSWQTPTSGGGSGGVTPLASSSILSIPASGKVFLITGSTDIGEISGGTDGREIILIFADALTVPKNYYHVLSSDFVSSTNSTLHLVYYFGVWFEVSRSIN